MQLERLSWGIVYDRALELTRKVRHPKSCEVTLLNEPTLVQGAGVVRSASESGAHGDKNYPAANLVRP